MKKIIGLLLVVAMTMILFAGCGSSENSNVDSETDSNVNQNSGGNEDADEGENEAERIARINGRETATVDTENGIATLYGEKILVHISYDTENIKIWDCNNLIADEYGVTMAEYQAEYLGATDGDRHLTKAFIGPSNPYENDKQDKINRAEREAVGDVIVTDFDDVKIGEYVLKHFALSYSYEHEMTANEVATWNSVLDYYYMELSDDEALTIEFDTIMLEKENQNGELESERELELEIVPYMITNIEVEEAN